MAKSKKHSKKQVPNERMRLCQSKFCEICRKESSSLLVNGFCSCVAKDDDYEFVTTDLKGGKKRKMRFIREDKRSDLKRRYVALGGVLIEGKRARLGQRSQSNKTPRPYLPTRDEKKVFYESWEWKEARYKAIKELGNSCMLCGANSKEVRIVVDHIRPISKYWDLRLDAENLQILCNDCNMGKSNNHYDDFRETKNST